jgi:hypothetical protein
MLLRCTSSDLKFIFPSTKGFVVLTFLLLPPSALIPLIIPVLPIKSEKEFKRLGDT